MEREPLPPLPNVEVLERAVLPDAVKLTTEPGVKLAVAPLMLIAPAVPGALTVKGALAVLEMAPLIETLP
jgi:hypothetical protein